MILHTSVVFRKPTVFILMFLLLLGTSFRVIASENYTGDFLMYGAGARALGMGSSAVAVTNDPTSVYHNPAGLALLESREVNLMHSEQFAGLINYNTFSAGTPLSETLFLGAALIHSGIGDIKYTQLIDPSQPIDDNNRPIIASREDATDYTLFLGMAKQYTDVIHIGGSAKIIRRSIADDTAFGYGIDIGIQYIPSEYVRIGASLKDATGTSIAWDGKANDRIAPTLDTGIATLGTVPLIGGYYILTGSIVFFGDSPDTKGLSTMNIGGEYRISDYLAFRAGSRQGTGTFGLGIMRLPLISSSSFDYAFLADDGLDSTHRISMTIRY